MDILLYGALLLAQAGTSTKQFAMKHCGKLAPGAFNSVCINMARALICLVVSVIIWISAGGGTTTLFGHVIIVIASVGTAFYLFTWILASQFVPLILVESTSMIGSLVVPLILAPYLYDGDTVSPLQWLGCVLIFVSVFLFMNKGKKTQKKGNVLQKAAIVVLSVVSITMTSIFKKYYTYYVTAKGLGSIEYFTLINFVTVLVVFLMLFAVYYLSEKKRASLLCTAGEKPKVQFPYKQVWIYILIAAAALYVNELFTSYATQLPSVRYYPLAKGLTIGCTFLLDVIVFKDQVTVKKIIGLITVIVAIVLVNL